MNSNTTSQHVLLIPVVVAVLGAIYFPALMHTLSTIACLGGVMGLLWVGSGSVRDAVHDVGYFFRRWSLTRTRPGAVKALPRQRLGPA